MSESPRVHDNRDTDLKVVGHISYGLHLVVALAAVLPMLQASVLLLVAAMVLDLIKRPDADGTWHAGHFRWRVHSVLVAGLLYLITAPLWLLLILPGQLAWLLVSIWLLYRVIKGWMYLLSNRPMPG